MTVICVLKKINEKIYYFHLTLHNFEQKNYKISDRSKINKDNKINARTDLFFNPYSNVCAETTNFV